MQVGTPPGRIALFGARPHPEPLAQAMVDLFVRRARMRASEVLAHQRKSRLEQVERCQEGIAR